MAKTQNELVLEEQKILDELIRDMDNVLLELNKRWTAKDLQAKKAKASCLADAYGMLVSAQHEKIVVREEQRKLRQIRDELYQTRIVVECTDSYGTDVEDIKIGLHTFHSKGKIFVMSWKMQLCRHYLLDNSTEEYESVVDGHVANYQLKLKRQIELNFDRVKSVIHMFPAIDEETESIIVDEFLQELLKRRSGQEFKNIVFSIQKKQGEIIQTPFKQDLIVQGCAGSGKSMIMLHRLPIVLYDNPNSLDRNNLYIITPSIAYIQMANNMRMDLEIEDLNMGTLEQYYDYVIEKYGVDTAEYGKIKPFLKLPEGLLKYIYSSRCVEDIKQLIHNAIMKGQIDCSYGYNLFGIKQQIRSAKKYSEVIRNELLTIQAPLNKNDEVRRKYHSAIWSALEILDEFARLLEGRKTAVLRAIDRQLTGSQKNLKKAQEDLLTIDRSQHDVKYKNRQNTIASETNNIERLMELRRKAEADIQYFEALENEAIQLRRLLYIFSYVQKDQEAMTIEQEYEAITSKEMIWNVYVSVVKSLLKRENSYFEYGDGYREFIRKATPIIETVQYMDDLYLPEAYTTKLLEARAYYSNLSKNIVKDTYLFIMKQLGQKPDEKGRLTALTCSPYLYIQILYNYDGAPAGAKESLITIDEAQNLEVEELRLIKNLNKGVILNLFGDVKQHVEGSKGIDSWNEISEIAPFKTEYMKENYRNARQITEFCNQRFDMDMRAINLDGSGLHVLSSEAEFVSEFTRVFQKPQNIGLSCILVKNQEEARTILSMAGIFKNRIHDLTTQFAEYDRKKWNLMTAEQAKGLEFETVFAISGRMSENEKYIAYTRALDELYVYDQEITIKQGLSFEEDEEKKTERPKKNTRGKREKRKK